MNCYRQPRPTRKQKVVIFDSPDGTGKTNIAQGLSMDLGVPYFRVPTQERNWAENSFIHSLRYGEPLMLSMVRQMELDVVLDRGYPAEWVYSQVYGRETDMSILERVDQGFADLGAYVVVPLRRDYTNVRKDDLVAKEMLPRLHEKYLEFTQWTKCSTVVIYVDDFKNDLRTEVGLIKTCFDWGGSLDHTTAAVFTKERREVGMGTPWQRGKAMLASHEMSVLGEK